MKEFKFKSTTWRGEVEMIYSCPRGYPERLAREKSHYVFEHLFNEVYKTTKDRSGGAVGNACSTADIVYALNNLPKTSIIAETKIFSNFNILE